MPGEITPGLELTPMNPAVSGDGTPHNFCPKGGLFGSKSSQFNEDLRCTLGPRLMLAGAIIGGGFLLFLVRNLVVVAGYAGSELFAPHVAATVLMGLTVLLLWKHRTCSLKKLRGMEAAVFGIPSAFFVWMQYCEVCHAVVGRIDLVAHSFPWATVLPWVLLIQIYALFVPNHWRRALLFMSPMAAAPLLVAAMSVARNDLVAAVMSDGGWSAMIIWCVIGLVTAVFGSHQFGAMRRQVFDARSVGVYTLDRRLGAGGMGEVYLGEHHLLKRPVAIKLIRPNKAGDVNAMARFESEVHATAGLTHPNTIEIYDYGRNEDGTFFYVMEYLPGMDLQQIVDAYGPLPAERAVHLLLQVCSALKEAHSRGLIHRDIKPGNVFAAERGGVYDVAKLLDFGLVKSTRIAGGSTKLTMDGTVVGSPLFAAPEATVDGRPDELSDVYSLGATLYYLVTGRAVFEGDNPLRVIFAHANDVPTPPREIDDAIPADLERVILRCLSKRPSERYVDVAELEAELTACESAGRWTQAAAAQWWATHDIRESSAGRDTPIDRDATAVMHVDTNDAEAPVEQPAALAASR